MSTVTKTGFAFEEFWNIEDIARLLKRTVGGVRTMRKLGHLPPAYSIGNRLYWSPAEFTAWLETRREDDDYDPGPPPRPR